MDRLLPGGVVHESKFWLRKKIFLIFLCPLLAVQPSSRWFGAELREAWTDQNATGRERKRWGWRFRKSEAFCESNRDIYIYI